MRTSLALADHMPADLIDVSRPGRSLAGLVVTITGGSHISEIYLPPEVVHEICDGEEPDGFLLRVRWSSSRETYYLSRSEGTKAGLLARRKGRSACWRARFGLACTLADYRPAVTQRYPARVAAPGVVSVAVDRGER